MVNTIEFYMKEAIACARQHDTPYGAVILQPEQGKKVIAANAVGQNGDPTAHAEIVALRQASGQNMELKGSILISTCEPCPMCAMAAIWAGVSEIYFGANIDDAAEHGNQVKIYSRELAEKAWYSVKIQDGILKEECKALFK